MAAHGVLNHSPAMVSAVASAKTITKALRVVSPRVTAS
jgi:hypothetical protein